MSEDERIVRRAILNSRAKIVEATEAFNRLTAPRAQAEGMRSAQKWADDFNPKHAFEKNETGVFCEFIRAIQQDAIASRQHSASDGWKLVPIEPTTVMDNAGAAAIATNQQKARNVYKAMLAVSPAPPEAHATTEREGYINGLKRP